tara:strand:+ start:13013 stop:13303 length:291 start_codon:yes stop_codon:yes gene_type:complete
MCTVTKLDIKTAIILEDARRIRKGMQPINNIRKLSFELIEKYPRKYKVDVLDKQLYHLHTKGVKSIDRTYRFDEIVEDLCELLNITKDDLVLELDQ